MLDTTLLGPFAAEACNCQVLVHRDGTPCAGHATHRVTGRHCSPFVVCARHAERYAAVAQWTVTCLHPAERVRFDGPQLDDDGNEVLHCYSCTACRMSFSTVVATERAA